MGLPQGGLVSVVIPACNAEATLPQTLASVRAQTYRLLEIIVVDDGSTDRTAEQVRRARADDPRVELISQSNGGVAAARNAGVAASGGEYVAFIDADDLWHPRKIELQVRAAERSVQLPVLVYAWSRRIDKTGRILTDQGRPRHRGHVFCDLIVANFLKNASTALIRREALLAAGKFDQDLRGAGAQGAEDLKLYLAVAERGYVELVPCFLVGYRSSSSSMSRAALNMRRSIEIVLAEVESSRPDLPAALFHMARMNYDLYAANLAFAERQWALFARLLARAVRRAPLIAPALVGVAALHRLQASVGRWVRWPTFDEVALDTSLPSTSRCRTGSRTCSLQPSAAPSAERAAVDSRTPAEHDGARLPGDGNIAASAAQSGSCGWSFQRPRERATRCLRRRLGRHRARPGDARARHDHARLRARLRIRAACSHSRRCWAEPPRAPTSS